MFLWDSWANKWSEPMMVVGFDKNRWHFGTHHWKKIAIENTVDTLELGISGCTTHNYVGKWTVHHWRYRVWKGGGPNKQPKALPWFEIWCSWTWKAWLATRTAGRFWLTVGDSSQDTAPPQHDHFDTGWEAYFQSVCESVQTNVISWIYFPFNNRLGTHGQRKEGLTWKSGDHSRPWTGPGTQINPMGLYFFPITKKNTVLSELCQVRIRQRRNRSLEKLFKTA